MPGPRLPPEISDCIVDLLRKEPEILKQCCLVSKSWVPRTRKHLFGRIEFERSADVDAWKKVFPDPANSPAYHTYLLSFACVHEVISAADAEESGWIRAFSRVVRLRVCDEYAPLLPSKFRILIRALPALENLDLGFLVIESSDNDTVVQPSTSPPLIRTLTLNCSFWYEQNFRWLAALIEECSDTLERVDIESSSSALSREDSTNLSKAKKLRELVFHPDENNIIWVATTLKTITSEHRDLRKVLIRFHGLPNFNDRQTDARMVVGDRLYSHWMVVDRTLIQLWELLAVCMEISYYSRGHWKRAREFVECLLPESTRRGIVKTVDLSCLR